MIGIRGLAHWRRVAPIGTRLRLAVPVVMLGWLVILPVAGTGPVELCWLRIIPMHWLIARYGRSEA